MLFKLEQHGKPTEYYWQDGAGPLRQLGTYGEVAEMAYRIVDTLTFGNFAAIPDLPEQPAEAALCYTVPEAVSAAQGLDADKRRLAESIRSAARAGRIAGAYRTPEGYWRLPVAAFNAWIAEHAEQRRGRPRKEVKDIATIFSVFNNAPDWARFHAVDENGAAFWYAEKPERLDDCDIWNNTNASQCDRTGMVYDMSGIDWRSTLAEREAAKEVGKA